MYKKYSIHIHGLGGQKGLSNTVYIRNILYQLYNTISMNKSDLLHLHVLLGSVRTVDNASKTEDD